MIRPVRCPKESRSYFPPGGSVIVLSMPANLSAIEYKSFVTSPMRDQNGMTRHGLIQVFEDKHSSFQRFCVVVLEAEDPLSRRGLGRPLAKSLLNRFDGSQIAIHVPQVRTAGGSRVRVGINESRQNGFSTQIYFPASGT